MPLIPTNNNSIAGNPIVAYGGGAESIENRVFAVEDKSTVLENAITYAGRILNMTMENYGTTMTLNGMGSGNAGGIIIVGEGTSASLWAFTYRAVTTVISLQKMGGNNNVTLTGSITSSGTITITASAGCQMTAIYCGNG